MSQNRVSHLEMIQGVVNRLAGASANCKTWTVTLTSAVFALAAKDAAEQYFWIALVPVVAFWFLDSYYLYQERLFRRLYDHVRIKQESEIDYSMNTSGVRHLVTSQSAVACSNSLLVFYLPLLATVLLVVGLGWGS